MLADRYEVCVCAVDVNRDAEFVKVEAENSNIIGTVCAVVVSVIFLIILILDLASIKDSLNLLRYNLRCSSDKQ